MNGLHPEESALRSDEVQPLPALGPGHGATLGQAPEPTVFAGSIELQEVIGGGGMAIVYRAWDRAHRRPCAVKVLADVLSRDEQFRLRFRQEAQAARGLTHPHIVTVYDCGVSGDHHYIVMEYVARGTLRELLKREGALQEATASRLASEVADALAYAHARGVIHRDIKPQNILLTEDGAAKVADFGIARSLDATSSLTRTGFVVGSVQYLSPEQSRGDPAGPASDLYALGVVLFEMLSGRVPFDADSAVGIALKHLREPAPDLRRLRPDVSKPTAAIVARLLAKSDRDRYPTAAALAVDLGRIASAQSRHQPPTAAVDVAGATRPSVSTSALAGSGATKQVSPSLVETAPLLRAPAPRARARQWRPQLGVATVWVLLALAAAGTGVWRGEHRVAVPPTTARTSAPRGAADNGATVPALVGRTVEAASQAASAVDLRLVVAERRPDPSAAAGTILSQDPPAGGRLNKGASLKVIISQGTGIVPELQGLSVTAAASRLQAAGLRLGRTIDSYGLGEETVGQVLSQSHAAGAQLTTGDAVDLVVSRGPMPPSPQSTAPRPTPPPPTPPPSAPPAPGPQPPTPQPPAPEQPSNP